MGIVHRKHLKLTEDNNDSISIRRAVLPFQSNTSAMRSVMTASQLGNMITPTTVERPICDSHMSQELWGHSTCVMPITAKYIKLLHKFTYQYRTIYIYQLDRDRIHIYDTDGTLNNKGYLVKMNTDLDSLTIDEEITIDSANEPFYLKYNDQFDPITRTTGIGSNSRCICSTNVHNASDSISASESFVNKYWVIKSKSPAIRLNNKTISSSYHDMFPKLGELLQDPILLKVLDGTSEAISLAQAGNIPSGFDDDVILIEPNSYLYGIEVYCNNPIEKNYHLEKHRLELLNFRRSVYDAISNLPVGKLTPEALIFKENFKYSKFRVGTQDLKDPYILLKINTLDKPKVGAKFGGPCTW